MRSPYVVGAVIVASTTLLVLLNKRARSKAKKLARQLWDGDEANEALKAELDAVSAVKKTWKTRLVVLGQQLEKIEQDIAEAEVSFATSSSPRSPLSATDTSAKSPASAAAASSYYHFDSKGNKFKNKWDSYDVDEELKALDNDEVSGQSRPIDKSGAVAKQRAALQKELGAAHGDLWKAQDALDSIVLGPANDEGDEDDAALRASRKALVMDLASVMAASDALQSRFKALRDYPKP